ncbi:sugar ABC transporter permease [Paenibacillus agaridevorans]|uniref:Sugar ABC transporter permease n=1 Tax=Paenibacillus agaridevorans TaxID=171404 RepID=A0A2R5EI27_9BACL|nr:ABC transporter permease subunit [Paenibacillus agaridevorans]GBG05745.1 sugar ABC transporter permease [Paenibacillus agaridevorans]
MNAALGTNKRKHKYKRFVPLYVMMVPGLLYLLINNYVPMAGIIIAFKHINWNSGILGSPFAGLSNFEYLFKTKEAWVITRNTLGYNVLFIVLGTVISIGVAILLNEIRSKFWKKSYQTVILLPYLISMVIVSYLVFAMLSSESGFVNNSILEPLGLDGLTWYTEPKYWPFILTIVHIWKVFGYSCIIYYATLVGIDRGYYEAAVIDGANRWQQIVNITLPALKPTVITLVLLQVGTIFYSDFGLFYQVPMDSGPLYDVTNTIDTYVYRGLIKLNDVGMSSAAGVYQSLVGFTLVYIANRLVTRFSKENALF